MLSMRVGRTPHLHAVLGDSLVTRSSGTQDFTVARTVVSSTS